MDDLVQFLRDRLNEDERAAQRADPGQWIFRTLGRHDLAAVKTETGMAQLDGSRATANAVHMTRHDPARVLREVEAKRRMLDEHTPARPPGRPNMERHCLSCTTAQTWDEASGESTCLTLRLLALPYADHPDYRNDWRP